MALEGLQVTLFALAVLSAVALVVMWNIWRRNQRPHAQNAIRWDPNAWTPEEPGNAALDLSPLAKRLAIPVTAEVITTGPVVAQEPPPAAEAREPVERRLRLLPAPRRPFPQSGMVDQAALQGIIEAGTLSAGVVVAVGINDLDGSMRHSPGVIRTVSSYLSGVLGGDGLLCRTAYDEFLLIRPQAPGESLEEKLNQLSGRLWEYGQRESAAGSILLTWGGVQFQDQTVAAAIASATDRMRRNKRIGNAISAVSASRRKVV